MSVTLRLCAARILRASSISFAFSSVTFLFQIERSSIHWRPKSFEVIEQACSKSCVISSLMTARRKGHVVVAGERGSAARVTFGARAPRPSRPRPARYSRRVVFIAETPAAPASWRGVPDEFATFRRHSTPVQNVESGVKITKALAPREVSVATSAEVCAFGYNPGRPADRIDVADRSPARMSNVCNTDVQEMRDRESRAGQISREHGQVWEVQICVAAGERAHRGG